MSIDDDALTQLVEEYRLGNLVESDGSDSDSEISIISESESNDKEDDDRASVDINSFEQVRGQLGSNVTELLL